MVHACLDPHEIDAWVAGEVASQELERLESHVDACARCRELVGHVARERDHGGSESLADSDTVEEPTPGSAGPRIVRGRGVHRIDRYVVERELGAGGMGVVYLANDPELHRSIVIKVLRNAVSARPQDHARMIREAQAMARVSHPNVVPIYDVGVHDRQVFLAMEYIDGGDLATWCEQRHPVREVIAVMCAAGRGLAAAHRAGLVHRDFKPANVMLAKSGEVKVTDFGLARSDGAPSDAAPSTPATILTTPITRTGAVVGTPAYMAPEQILGRDVDARTDQFSFCVMLYEALYGVRPFSGDTVDEQFDSTLDGTLPKQPSRRIPGHVVRALHRGLAREPEDRFPTMDALLAALAPRTGRRAVLAGAAAAIALFGGAALVLDRGDEPPKCTGANDELAGVWNPPRRIAIAGAFAATGSPIARIAFEQLAGDVDRYAEAWRGRFTAACEATRIRGDQTEEAMGLRVHCLHQRRAELDALLGVLGRADAALVGQSHEVVARLANPVVCDDVDALAAAKLPVDPQKRAAVIALESRLAGAVAELAGYHFDAASKLATAVLADAERVGHKPLVAQTLLALAEIAEGALQMQAAEQYLLSAVEVADQAGDDRIRATAYLRLASVAVQANKLADADRWIRRARATIERLGGDRYLLAELELRAASILVARDDRAGAEAGFRRAIAQLAALYGPQSKEVGYARNDLAAFFSRVHDFERAVTELDHAREAFATAFGDRSPQVGATLSLMGFARFQQQRYDEAFALGERGLAIARERLGADNPILLKAYEMQGYVVQALGRTDDAIQLQREVVALAARPGASPQLHAGALDTLGYLEIRAKRYADAAIDLGHARAIYRDLNDTDALGTTGDALAIAFQKQGDYTAALALLDENRARLVELGKSKTPRMADTLTRIGAADVDGKAPTAAVEPLEQALAIRRTIADPSSSSWTKYELARALWDAGRDRARALALAGEAEAEATSSGDREQLAKIVAWRAVHR